MATKIVRTRCLSNLFGRSVPKFYVQKTELTGFGKFSNFNNTQPNDVSSCKFSVSAALSGTAGHAETTSTTQGLSKLQAQELILRLNGEERNILMTALREYQSKLIKDEYEGKT